MATIPVTRDLVRRFVAGTTMDDAVGVTRALTAGGLAVTLDHLGEDTSGPKQAAAARDEYVRLLEALAAADLTPAAAWSGAGANGGAGAAATELAAEVSVKLSALGLRFDEESAYQHAAAICAAAAAARTTVTVDMEDHTTTDATLEIVAKLRRDHPETGVALQSQLRRTEADCRDLATAGSRVRLCKGAYAEPESVAYQARLEVDKSFVRCLNILMSGDGYPMLATHDPRLIAIGQDRARWFGRSREELEFQMLYGVRPVEQLRLMAEGYPVRVYVPYGTQWYGYLMRRLAERPANLAFFARALRSRR